MDIKSAIYEVEDTDLYTFYLSPSNGVTGMDDMTAVNDFLRIAVRNPKGTVNTETDEFEIAYKDIAVNRNTLEDRCREGVATGRPGRRDLEAQPLCRGDDEVGQDAAGAVQQHLHRGRSRRA